MSPLPPVPNFDPDANPDANADADPTAAAPSPLPVPAPGAFPPPAAAATPADDEVPKTVPAPAAPPDPADSAVSVKLGDTGVQESVVQDSVEEVLQQASEQTLRLSHLEDILSALNQTLTDLRDEMHAGFAEMRAITEGSGDTNRPTEASFKTSLTERLDFVEEQTTSASKKTSGLMIVAIVQAVLLLITLIAVISTGGSTEPPPESMPAYMSSDVKPEPGVKPEPPPPDLRPTKAKRRKRRR